MSEKSPPKAPRAGALASFEDWDGLVRNAVLWLAERQDLVELADPVGTIDEAEDRDGSKGALWTLLDRWNNVFGSRPLTASEILTYANTSLDRSREWSAEPSAEETERLQFRDALVDAVRMGGRKQGDVTALELGKWLGAQKDVVVGGYRVESDFDRRNKVAMTRVVRL